MHGPYKIHANKNDLQVQAIPRCLGEQGLETKLRLHNFLAIAETPMLRQSVDLGFNGKAGRCSGGRSGICRCRSVIATFASNLETALAAVAVAEARLKVGCMASLGD